MLEDLPIFFSRSEMEEFLSEHAKMCPRLYAYGLGLDHEALVSQGGPSIVKNTGGCLDSLGSGILFVKYILGFFQKIDLDDSYG